MALRPDGSPSPLVELAGVMRRLRVECPWKAAQTHRSLARYLLEETHETLEALDTGDAAHLREELGDLLLQVYFHAAIAEEAGAFTLDDVAEEITSKLRRRNPHVFGPPAARGAAGARPTAAEVDATWQRVKAAEKQRTSPTEGLPPTLPALLLALKYLERTAEPGTPVLERPALADEQPAPAAPADDPEHEVGERLLALVAQARSRGVDPEQALRAAVRRRSP